MIQRLLIANRGEIACRIVATAKRLAIGTVVVYSDADRASLACSTADEAYRIGPAAAADSYLNSAAILAAARATHADAIHPGYGFLAENADFAQACAAAGLTFVGPPPAAIRAMGSKHRAKQIMAGAGVPILPGYPGEQQDTAVLRTEARRIGYPVMIKPTGGGGGKGMRRVMSETEFESALAAARREARAFGDDHVLLERYLERARHVEVQICRDRHGNAVHLFDRDCSLQRRHQKILEEAPAPGLDATTRAAMTSAAIAAAHAIDYEGVGTIEFLLEPDGSFYFMEMNTRLQVEHPVTEMITGEDLVEWQLRLAAGENVPRTQDELRPHGHALEVRLYAEDPTRGFLPATGRLGQVRFPSGAGVRVDTGIRRGDLISPHYDPLIAKLAVWGADRAAAHRRLTAALGDTLISGVATNLRFLEQLAAHPDVDSTAYDIGLVERRATDLDGRLAPPDPELIAVASCGVWLDRARRAEARAANSGDPYSPWHDTRGWRLNGPSECVVEFVGDGGAVRTNVVNRGTSEFSVQINDQCIRLHAVPNGEVQLRVEIDGLHADAVVARDGAILWILYRGRRARLEWRDPAARAPAARAAHGELIAPMPGRVVKLNVTDGQRVEAGSALMVLEAMKMEHTIAAPHAGTIVRVHFAAGDLVEEGAELLDFAPLTEPAL